MKNYKINYFVYLLLSFIALTISCKKDWFDAKSDINKAVPVTVQDFEYLLDDWVTMNQLTPGLAELGSDGHFMLESAWSGSIISSVERNGYTWTKSLATTNVGDWNESYKKISICNLVLDGLKKIKVSQDQDKYNRVKGNALFHRAKNYYDLAQIYAQPYQSETAATDMGIPLKEGIDITEPAKRSSVKVTYEQILSDLHSSINLLPLLPELPTRGSKCAAFAMLAKTYLALGDFANAGLYADMSLSLYNKLIDFNTVLPTATSLGRFNLETIFYAQRSTSYFSTYRTGYYTVDPELYALYDANDLRKSRFFTLSAGNILFKGSYNNSAGGITAGFNGLAVDEQYLIRAECFARVGNPSAAMNDLNNLLKTRWSNQVVYPIRTATNTEDALRQVLLERKKELLFRNIRWSDLRRLNFDSRFKVTLTRTIGGKTYTLEPGSYRYTLPIPQDVINLAPQMKQTPGW